MIEEISGLPHSDDLEPAYIPEDIVQSGLDEQTESPPAENPEHFAKVLDLLSVALPDEKLEDLIADGVQRTPEVLVVTVIAAVLKTAKRKQVPLIRQQGAYYIFDERKYVEVGVDDLKEFLGAAALKMGVSLHKAMHYVFRENLLRQFESQGYFPPPKVDETETTVNFSNGTLVIKPDAIAFEKHSPDRLIFYVLPFIYDTLAKYPTWQNFLDRVIPDKEKQMVLAEFMASSFISSKILKLEKVLLLFGSGANGKSVAFEVLTAAMGQENVSNYSLTALCDEKGYSRAELTGKRLNWASEISGKLNTTVFKSLASREPIEARRPYGRSFIQYQIPPLAFNTNVLPRDVEFNHGFYRRFCLIHFDQTIPVEERDPSLAAEIISTELPGVFNWILEGLERLLQNRGLTRSSAIENAIEEYRKKTDSIMMFIEESGLTKSTTAHLSLKEVFKHYREFCSENGLVACSVKSFSERISDQGFIVKRMNKGRIVFATNQH